MTAESSTFKGENAAIECRSTMNGTEPVTDYDSQTVMLAAERHDNIHITDIVTSFTDEVAMPDRVSVIAQSQTYYGPSLLVHADLNGEDHNYLLTAPGPSSQLYLWAGDGPIEGKRRRWVAVAEIKAALATEQPPYRKCPQCGELIRTIEHERESVLDNCSRVKTTR